MPPPIRTRRDLRALPKAHLHLHLEAAQRPALLRELCERYALPTPEPGDGTFATFRRAASVVFTALHTPDDYLRLVREMAEDAAAEGAVWVEPAVLLTQAQAERLGLAHAEAGLTRRLYDLVLGWDEAGRPTGDHLRVRAYPRGTEPVASGTLQVITKNWASLALEWI